MARKRAAYRGCLLGLAVGDAMGYTVDSHTLAEIREDYGPSGLRGYDPVNGYAEITSYTQLAAFTANGLLYGLTQGRTKGTMSPFIQYIARGYLEWAGSQQVMDRPKGTVCWLFHEKTLCQRHCMDTRMKEVILRKRFATPEEPGNNMNTPSTLTTAVGAALFFDPVQMERREITRLGMEAVALTHGDPLTFLSGAFLTELVTGVLLAPENSLDALVERAQRAFTEQFDGEYRRHVNLINGAIKQAVTMSRTPDLAPVDAMERLQCRSAEQVLAGAVYALLAGNGDFDISMIIAVNHSGASAAVGALVGALLGAKLGQEVLPEFYLECLEPAMLLVELADDLYHGCPMEMGSRMFDGDWDRKYLHGGK